MELEASPSVETNKTNLFAIYTHYMQTLILKQNSSYILLTYCALLNVTQEFVIFINYNFCTFYFVTPATFHYVVQLSGYSKSTGMSGICLYSTSKADNIKSFVFESDVLS